MIDAASDQLIPLHEVAKRFQVSRECVRRWRVNKGLECCRVGGRWYTTADAINRFASRSGGERKQDARHNDAVRQLRSRFGIDC